MSGFRPKAGKAYESALRTRRHKVAAVAIDDDMPAAQYVQAVSDAYYAEQVRVIEAFAEELGRSGEVRGRLVFEMPGGAVQHLLLELEEIR